MSLGFLDLIAVSITAFLTVMVFWVLKQNLIWGRPTRSQQTASAAGQITFLIEGENVIDCSPEAAAILASPKDGPHTCFEIIATLEPIFPSLGDILAQRPTTLQTIVANENSAIWVEVAPVGSRYRLSIRGQSPNTQEQLKFIRDLSEYSELAGLRETMRNTPQLMWRTNSAGHTIWANDAYLAACDANNDLSANIPKLPSKPLFTDLEEYVNIGTSSARCSVKMRDEEEAHWFDITSVRTAAGTQYFATNADSIVRAEQGQRKFVQTLSQTFAQLSIGLAIFDRRRQLATFNPALLDMTSLPFEFLSGRPSIDAMLDRLREHRMLPEPKNYSSWREQFSAMEQAARDGTYSENWNLPDGQTFRVTGRPHPDGAFALLFEDISAEISLTRRFRSEIETSQAVIDTLDEAIAVFSGGGNLVLANDAYCTLWDTGLELGLNRHDLRVEMRKWQSRCTPTKIWSDLREIADQTGARQSWTDTAIFDDGRQITCVASPIRGGMTMIRFNFGGSKKHVLRKVGHDEDVLRIGVN